MARINMTLDGDTSSALSRYAKAHHKALAAVARELLLEGLKRREAVKRARNLARDYAGGRTDTRELLGEIELGQLDLLMDDGWK